MDNLLRDYRVFKLILKRLINSIKALVEPKINIENLTTAECLLTKYCEAKQKFTVINDQILSEFDEADKEYEDKIAPFLKDATAVSNTLSKFQGIVTNFRKQFSAENIRDLLVNNPLNQSFHVPNSTAPPLEKTTQSPISNRRISFIDVDVWYRSGVMYCSKVSRRTRKFNPK